MVARTRGRRSVVVAGVRLGFGAVAPLMGDRSDALAVPSGHRWIKSPLGEAIVNGTHHDRMHVDAAVLARLGGLPSLPLLTIHPTWCRRPLSPRELTCRCPARMPQMGQQGAFRPAVAAHPDRAKPPSDCTRKIAYTDFNRACISSEQVIDANPERFHVHVACIKCAEIGRVAGAEV